MKYVITSVILSLVLSLSFMQAKATSQNLESMIATNKAATISQADANFLFSEIETSKVALLDSKEMKETKGEVHPLWLAFSFFINYGYFANAPAPGDTIYEGTILQNLGSSLKDDMIEAYYNL
ncbi:hypothetical protein CQA66_04230 [Helicobacter aurati]|uniref:Uncharacterized protein n=1 Tax=Helicobacter aurati TaxID=137778 RepID=A0A3D8J5R8_9HELI|nr:hypothetical protein [Helicobacter aurati]RDU72526.1 hypothetical protein CQA66_04230 [Helicobacter aurati]